MEHNHEEFEQTVTQEIERFVREDPGNRLDRLDNTPIYQTPLVGFVSGTDPLFARLKEVIGEFHLTPVEAMEKIAGIRGIEVPDSAQIGVISYILPISQATRDANAGMTDNPSERWANTRLFGQEFNDALEQHIAAFLEEQGYIAFAPDLEKLLFTQVRDETVGFASTWSQRHVAYAAGLGTFGLSDGLITAAGKSHRCGSIVVNHPFESPPRPADIHQYCLFYQNGGCKICVERCPVGAITEQGHAKDQCAKFV